MSAHRCSYAQRQAQVVNYLDSHVTPVADITRSKAFNSPLVRRQQRRSLYAAVSIFCAF